MDGQNGQKNSYCEGFEKFLDSTREYRGRIENIYKSLEVGKFLSVLSVATLSRVCGLSVFCPRLSVTDDFLSVASATRL